MTGCWGRCWVCCAPTRRGRSRARRRTGPGGRCCCRTCWPRPATSPPAPTQPQDTAADASWLLDRAATYLQVHARLAEARPLAERALAIDEAAYGPDHPDVATVLNNLAHILQDLGQLAEARPLAERALAIAEAAYGPDHPDVAIRLSNLAPSWQTWASRTRPGRWPSGPWPSTRPPTAPTTPPSATRPEQPRHHPAGPGPARREARPLAERALAIDEAAYGPDHPDVAIRPEQPRHHPGTTWASPGEARPLTERALAIDEAAYGPDHPTSPPGLNNLAQILQALGAARARPGRWPSAPWPSPRPPTAPTTPTSPSA